MASLFARINFSRFWPNTMDYSKVFGQISFCTHNSSLEGAAELKFVSFCSSRNALSDGILICQKPWTKSIVHGFGQIYF